MTKEITNARITSRLVVLFLFCSAAFFGTAGTLKWPEAWLYLILTNSCIICIVVWLKKNDPVLLRDRMCFDKKSPKGADRIIMLLYFIFCILMIALPGLDTIRFKWSGLPLFIKVTGFLLAILSSYIMFLVVKENPYLSSIVEVHEDKEHKVVTSGLYRHLRHPWYLGLILWFFSIPLALGSLYTFIPALLLTILLILRIFIEEKALGQELPGYKDYCQTVKYRILPYIW